MHLSNKNGPSSSSSSSSTSVASCAASAASLSATTTRTRATRTTTTVATAKRNLVKKSQSVFGQTPCSSSVVRRGPWTVSSMLMANGGRRWPLVTMLLLTMVLLGRQQTGECRYLPTRSHTDDLDKLRELMLQILESNSNEEPPASSGVAPRYGGRVAAMGSGGDHMLENAADNWLDNLATWNAVETPARKRYPGIPSLPALRSQVYPAHGGHFY